MTDEMLYGTKEAKERVNSAKAKYYADYPAVYIGTHRGDEIYRVDLGDAIVGYPIMYRVDKDEARRLNTQEVFALMEARVDFEEGAYPSTKDTYFVPR